MSRKLLLLLPFCFSFTWVSGQNCVPEAAVSMSLSDNGILSWITPEADNCVSSYYIIDIETDTEHYLYFTAGSTLDVSFLPICEYIRFTVRVVSPNNLESEGLTMRTQLSPAHDEDLTLSFLRISSNNGRITLQWDVDENFRRCVVRFRLTVYDQIADYPVDRYLRGYTATLTDLVPCTQYIFGVAAVHSAVIEGTATYVRYTSAVAVVSPPVLQRVILGDTSARLTWELESYSINRCALSSLVVEALPYFSISYVLPNQINRIPYTMNLTGLLPDTLYILNVTIVNEAGPSAPTLVGIQTLARN